MHNTNFTDDDLLMLSGIQHMAFCERQYSLAYIELQWQENVLTLEGHFLHEQVDDPYFSEWRNSVRTIRSVPVVSYQLGLTGIADLVELVAYDSVGVTLSHPDTKTPVQRSERVTTSHPLTNFPYTSIRPVEYKRGKPKPDDRDQVQLCAQAMCLEEMTGVSIPSGSMFYGQIRRRDEVEFSPVLRQRVTELSEKMHRYFREAFTPPPVYKSHCKACSLFDICLPASLSKKRSVNTYLNNHFEE